MDARYSTSNNTADELELVALFADPEASRGGVGSIDLAILFGLTKSRRDWVKLACIA
jgi:hypothetical protein